MGNEFKCEEGLIEMSQTKYLEKFLYKFNMMDCKPKSTPCDIDANNVEDEDTSPSPKIDCIRIPKVGIADCFLAKYSLYFRLIVNSNVRLDGQDQSFV